MIFCTPVCYAIKHFSCNIAYLGPIGGRNIILILRQASTQIGVCVCWLPLEVVEDFYCYFHMNLYCHCAFSGFTCFTGCTVIKFIFYRHGALEESQGRHEPEAGQRSEWGKQAKPWKIWSKGKLTNLTLGNWILWVVEETCSQSPQIRSCLPRLSTRPDNTTINNK